MPRLVHGGDAAPAFVDCQAAAFTAPVNLVAGFFKLRFRDFLYSLAGGQQGGLIDQIGKLGAGKTGRTACDALEADIGRHLHFLGVHLQDLFAAADIRKIHHHLAVKTSGPQQSRVQNVRALVAAITITLALFSKPSISTSRAFRVCSLSSLPPPMP